MHVIRKLQTCIKRDRREAVRKDRGVWIHKRKEIYIEVEGRRGFDMVWKEQSIQEILDV